MSQVYVKQMILEPRNQSLEPYVISLCKIDNLRKMGCIVLCRAIYFFIKKKS
uniref:Uncharacterized protein n=1 Tax=Clostridium botulinum TaxID=1491 RepID=A0A126JJK0_CLOBO|nr:hypothetical protein [Clostridium botulinum]